MRPLLYTIILLCLLTNAMSQRVCGSEDYLRKQLVSDPFYLNNSPVNINNPNTRVTSPANTLRDTLNNEVIIIPVVIHILYNNDVQNISSAQVQSQLDVLNNDYRRTNSDASNTPGVFLQFAADARIRYCLAKTDAQGKPTSGVLRKFTSEQTWQADDAMKFSSSHGDDAWDATRYLNIWVCNLFGRTLGYATYPGGPANKDGLVIQYDVFGTTGTVRYPYNKGRTATHEIGHWLGLKHLWGDADCGTDDVADTPPQQTYSNGCPSFPQRSSCSINPNGDMYMNYMDFTDDACMNMFTAGQKTKMRMAFALGGKRNSFLNATGCDSTNPEGGPLPADTVAAAKPSTNVRLYPNPAINTVTVTCNNPDNVVGNYLHIYTMMGKEIFTTQLKSQSTSIDVSRLIPGMYIVKLGEGSGRVVLKFNKM